MSAARTRGHTGRRKKITDAELEEQARKYAEAKRASAGIPSGESISAGMLEKCKDETLQLEERMLKLTHEPTDATKCPAAKTNLSCPKNYTDAKRKFLNISPDRNKGCTELATAMMKKYQECCYAQVDNPRKTFVKWDRNDRTWRNPRYESWYPRLTSEERAEQDAVIARAQSELSSKRDDFGSVSASASTSSRKPGRKKTSALKKGSTDSSEDPLKAMRRQFEAEYGEDLAREKKRLAKEAKRDKAATKIQAVHRGRTSRRKKPSAALCRMCKAKGFYDPKCDLCPGREGKKESEISSASGTEESSGSLEPIPSIIPPFRSKSGDYTDPPSKSKDDDGRYGQCRWLNGSSGWIDMRSKKTRKKNRKTCIKTPSCQLEKHKTKNRYRCVTRKKGRKKKKRKPRRICAGPEDCPENQICKDNICVPVEAGMIRPVGEAIPRTNPGAILKGQSSTVEGKSAAALRRADKARRERLSPSKPKVFEARKQAEEARDPMADFRLFLISENCPKLTLKEIEDLENLFD